MTDRQILDLEALFWRTPGAKEDAIRGLGLDPVRYYQRLSQLLESETALSYNPVVVNRLRRIAGLDAVPRNVHLLDRLGVVPERP
ncbi:hypothetical protein BST17_24935 [Mycolicibacterium bacteremicum]|uniref:DUF3263 domain-containing protein n=1 Tax=Mycolicibacterium bacteremicum TaxID=564198 RepID=A0A1W9YQ93_MYCBA|nr:hypothetical protein BST17_24935 [Mycolicibacterium bacteremicum]